MEVQSDRSAAKDGCYSCLQVPSVSSEVKNKAEQVTFLLSLWFICLSGLQPETPGGQVHETEWMYQTDDRTRFILPHRI